MTFHKISILLRAIIITVSYIPENVDRDEDIFRSRKGIEVVRELSERSHLCPFTIRRFEALLVSRYFRTSGRVCVLDLGCCML